VTPKMPLQGIKFLLMDYMQQWKGKVLHDQFFNQVEALTTVGCAYE